MESHEFPMEDCDLFFLESILIRDLINIVVDYSCPALYMYRIYLRNKQIRMEDEQYYPVAFVDPTLSDPYIMGIVGNIGSGKTHLVKKLIKMYKFKFDIIVW